MTVKLALALSVLATSAFAVDFKPYVGFDVGTTNAKFKDQSLGPIGMSGNVLQGESFLEASPRVGVQLTPNLAVEASYARSDSEKKAVNFGGFAGVSTKTSYQTLGIDAVGSLPVADKLSALASLGAVQIHAKSKTNGNGFLSGFSSQNSTNDTTYRVGAGVSYAFSPCVDGRVMVRYTGSAGNLDHATTALAGVAYKF